MFLQHDEMAIASQQINAFDLTFGFTPWMSERNPIGSLWRSKPACACLLLAAQTCQTSEKTDACQIRRLKALCDLLDKRRAANIW